MKEYLRGSVTNLVYHPSGVCKFEFLPNRAFSPTVLIETGWHNDGGNAGKITYAYPAFKFDGFEFTNILIDQELKSFITTCEVAFRCAKDITETLKGVSHENVSSIENVSRFINGIAG